MSYTCAPEEVTRKRNERLCYFYFNKLYLTCCPDYLFIQLASDKLSIKIVNNLFI